MWAVGPYANPCHVPFGLNMTSHFVMVVILGSLVDC
jgi:hypothetical protein